MKIFIQHLIGIFLIIQLPTSLAGSSFGLTINTNWNCTILPDQSAPIKQTKGTLNNKGNCIVSIPYTSSPVSFCALVSVGGGGSFNKNVAPGYLPPLQNATFCKSTIVNYDKNYKLTDDKSLWRLEFFAQKGLMCEFVCVEL